MNIFAKLALNLKSRRSSNKNHKFQILKASNQATGYKKFCAYDSLSVNNTL